MHIVTKFLVLAAAVLSVLLAALTIAYASNASRIVAEYNDEGARRVAAEARLATAALQQGEAQVRLQAEVQQLSQSLAERDAEIARLRTQAATLQADRLAAETARQGIEGEISRLGETARTQATLISNYRDEVVGLRRNELSFRQRDIEQGDRISDLESQREVLEQTVRALQEQLAEIRLTMETQAQGGTTAGRANEPFVSAGPRITGRVEEVSSDRATGATLAKISVGTSDQVRENMKFAVVRDNQFIANLVVVSTDLRFSIGRVDTLGQNVNIQPGDRILSRLN